LARFRVARSEDFQLSQLRQLHPEQLGNLIPNGASLALAPDYSGCALSVIRALIRRSGRTST
jgi:hypothetical protein